MNNNERQTISQESESIYIENNNVEPLVSVLVTAYNSAETISKCLASIAQQTYGSIEILVHDDCSSDNTKTKVIAMKLPNLTLYTSNKNIGYLESFNKLLKHCNGKYIAFLDSDDTIADVKIEKQVKFLETNQDVGIVGTNFSRMGPTGRKLYRSALPLKNEEIQEQLKNSLEVPFCGSSVMVRGSLIKQYGGYDEYFKNCPSEDFEWIRRLSNITKTANLPEHLYNYRMSNSSLTSNPKTTLKARHSQLLAKKMADLKAKGYQRDEIINILSTLELELEKNELHNPSVVLRKLCVENAICKKPRSTLRLYLKTLVLDPFNCKNLILFFIIVACMILPYSALAFLKAKFGVQHISQRI